MVAEKSAVEEPLKVKKPKKRRGMKGKKKVEAAAAAAAAAAAVDAAETAAREAPAKPAQQQQQQKKKEKNKLTSNSVRHGLTPSQQQAATVAGSLFGSKSAEGEGGESSGALSSLFGELPAAVSSASQQYWHFVSPRSTAFLCCAVQCRRESVPSPPLVCAASQKGACAGPRCGPRAQAAGL